MADEKPDVCEVMNAVFFLADLEDEFWLTQEELAVAAVLAHELNRAYKRWNLFVSKLKPKVAE